MPASASTSTVSDRKRIANRLNAQRSTGPRTAEGKARSSQNGLTHGLTAQPPVLPGEDEAEFTRFSTRLRAELRPAGEMQAFVVERIIHLAWKLRRVAYVERSIVETSRDRSNRTSWDRRQTPDLPGVQVIARELSCRDGGAIGRLTIYEQRIERALHAAMRELRTLREEQDPAELQDAAAAAAVVAVAVAAAPAADVESHEADVAPRSPSPGTPGEGRVRAISPCSSGSMIATGPHPNPLLEYGEMGPDAQSEHGVDEHVDEHGSRESTWKTEPTAADNPLCGHAPRDAHACGAGSVEPRLALPTIADASTGGHPTRRDP